MGHSSSRANRPVPRGGTFEKPEFGWADTPAMRQRGTRLWQQAQEYGITPKQLRGMGFGEIQDAIAAAEAAGVVPVGEGMRPDETQPPAPSQSPQTPVDAFTAPSSARADPPLFIDPRVDPSAIRRPDAAARKPAGELADLQTLKDVLENNPNRTDAQDIQLQQTNSRINVLMQDTSASSGNGGESRTDPDQNPLNRWTGRTPIPEYYTDPAPSPPGADPDADQDQTYNNIFLGAPRGKDADRLRADIELARGLDQNNPRFTNVLSDLESDLSKLESFSGTAASIPEGWSYVLQAGWPSVLPPDNYKSGDPLPAGWDDFNGKPINNNVLTEDEWQERYRGRKPEPVVDPLQGTFPPRVSVQGDPGFSEFFPPRGGGPDVDALGDIKGGGDYDPVTGLEFNPATTGFVPPGGPPGDDGTQPPPPPGDDGTQPPPPPGDDGTQPPPPPGDDGTQPPPPPGDDGTQPPPPPGDSGTPDLALLDRFPEFRASFRKKKGQEGFQAKFDYNTDDIVDFTDFLLFAGGQEAPTTGDDGSGLPPDDGSQPEMLRLEDGTLVAKNSPEGRAFTRRNAGNINLEASLRRGDGQPSPDLESEFQAEFGRLLAAPIGARRTGGWIDSQDAQAALSNLTDEEKQRFIDNPESFLLEHFGVDEDGNINPPPPPGDGTGGSEQVAAVDADGNLILTTSESSTADGRIQVRKHDTLGNEVFKGEDGVWNSYSGDITIRDMTPDEQRRGDTGVGWIDNDGDGYDDNTFLDQNGDPKPGDTGVGWIDNDGDGYDDNTFLDQNGNPKPGDTDGGGGGDTGVGWIDNDGDGYDDNTFLDRNGKSKPSATTDPTVVTDQTAATAIDDILNTFRNDLLSDIQDQEGPTTEDQARDIISTRQIPLENRATQLAEELEFDTGQQIADSDAELDLLFEQAKEATARAFAIDAGGLESGASQRNFENLERDLAIAKAQKRQTIRDKAGSEQRANIETISGLLSDTENRNIARATLDLQQRAQEFGETVTEAQLTGIYQKVGSVTFNEFSTSMNSVEGDDNYDPRFDFDGDGTIGFHDYLEFKDATSNNKVTTLAGQQLQNDLAQQTFDQTVTRAGLKGTFEGQQTVQDMQRTYDNGLAYSTIFGTQPPVTYTEEAFQGSLGAIEGDVNYRSDFDLDNDGKIGLADFRILADRTTDMGNGVLLYQPPGPQTLTARELGIAEDEYTEAVRQFDVGMRVRNQEFLTQTTGMVFEHNPDGTMVLDARGRPVLQRMKIGVDEFGTVITRELTSLERDQFQEAQDQFEQSAEDTLEMFFESLGFDREAMEKELKSDRLGHWLAMIGQVGGAWVSRRKTPNITFGGGGRNNPPPFQPGGQQRTGKP